MGFVKMKGKKGEGATITWMTATIVIVVLLVMFLIFSFVLVGQKYIGGGDEIVSGQAGGSKLSVQQDLFVFLNGEIEINGEMKKVVDVVYEYNIGENPAKEGIVNPLMLR